MHVQIVPLWPFETKASFFVKAIKWHAAGKLPNPKTAAALRKILGNSNTMQTYCHVMHIGNNKFVEVQMKQIFDLIWFYSV